VTSSAKPNVLVVDDNADLLDNVCEILETVEDLEIRPALALNRHEAIEVCRSASTALDLALVDLRLPDSDGLRLSSEIQELCPFAAVVLITGDASLESAIAALEQRAFAYVTKPFRAPELLRTARSAIAKARAERESELLKQSLEASERRHREVVDAVPAFVLALDAEGRIALWNQELERVTGYERSEMLGRPGREWVGEGGEARLPLKDGGHRLARWQSTQLVGPEGTPVTYALGLDVTEERDMLRRTLQTERLAAVGTLAAGLAHEVRNPLNSALLQLQVLRRRVEKGQREPASLLPVVEVVGGEIRRLDRLVSDFLAFARPRPLELRPVLPNEFMQAMADLVRPEAEERGIAVELRLDRNVGPLDGDPEGLRQVILNLVRNAIEAMGTSGTLLLATEPADAEGNLALVVQDDGPGFQESAPVFDAFYTSKEGGTGLGLAIVHRLVTEHGGSVAVETRPGRTRFTLRLPQRAADRPPR
jgi:signal transduction histidine kinase